MKAIVFHEHGGPNVLRYEDVEKPRADPGSVLLKIRASSLNHLDIVAREGIPGLAIPLPHILGTDICGRVEEEAEESGEKLSSSDDDVVAYPGVFCGSCEHCRSGHENLCPNFKLIGFFTDGGFAEYASVPRRNLFQKPRRLSHVEAATIPLVFLTAWHALVAKAGVARDDTVLIPSAGGGLGIACTQLAKHLGATVIATAGTDEKVEKAKKLGADYALNYANRDWVKEVQGITGGKGVDIIVDQLGGSAWASFFKLARPGGRIVSVASLLGEAVETHLANFYLREVSVRGAYVGTITEMTSVLRLFEDGELEPVVDSVYELPEARAAEERLEARKNFGKIVLRVS